MAWSPQQEDALRRVRTWLNTFSQVFYLAGFAGTGKTTLAKHLAADVRGTVLYAAFTGKAASVLRSKGCTDASTIHRLIYKVREELERDSSGQYVPVVRFGLDRDSDIRSAGLVIIDECSMVDEKLGRDLLSFGTKVLVLGDPAQLPPVKGEGFFTSRTPDVTLTEIHRQACDNPIIRLSMMVREGERLAAGRYGDSEVIAGDVTRPSEDRVLAANQILVGTNKKRLRNNAIYRSVTRRDGNLPQEGEKLVCLKNNHDRGLLNGGMWFVDSVLSATSQRITLEVRPEEQDWLRTKVRVPPEFFVGKEDDLHWTVKKDNDQFTFGYALTVHKAQGSQWNDVVIFDESPVFREFRTNHLYTAITRAAEKVTVVL